MVMRLMTLYATLLTVSSTAIVLGTGVSILKAVSVAAVGCVAKTIAVRLHDAAWNRRKP